MDLLSVTKLVPALPSPLHSSPCSLSLPPISGSMLFSGIICLQSPYKACMYIVVRGNLSWRPDPDIQEVACYDKHSGATWLSPGQTTLMPLIGVWEGGGGDETCRQSPSTHHRPTIGGTTCWAKCTYPGCPCISWQGLDTGVQLQYQPQCSLLWLKFIYPLKLLLPQEQWKKSGCCTSMESVYCASRECLLYSVCRTHLKHS